MQSFVEANGSITCESFDSTRWYLSSSEATVKRHIERQVKAFKHLFIALVYVSSSSFASIDWTTFGDEGCFASLSGTRTPPITL